MGIVAVILGFFVLAWLGTWFQVASAGTAARSVRRRLIRPLDRQKGRLGKLKPPLDLKGALQLLKGLPKAKQCENASGTTAESAVAGGTAWAQPGMTSPDAALVLSQVLATMAATGVQFGCLAYPGPKKHDASVFLARSWEFSKGRVRWFKNCLVSCSTVRGIRLRMANEGGSFVVQMLPTYVCSVDREDMAHLNMVSAETQAVAAVLQQSVVLALQQCCPQAVP